jgi:3-keto-disaccharide hydrolase
MRLLVTLLVIIAPSALQAQDSKSKFVPLFDGKSLDGWVVKGEPGKEAPKDEWLVKDGTLTVKPGHSWLSTSKTYGDFTLRLQWRVPENGNSGVFIHVPDLKPGEQPYVQGIEIQVLDDSGPEYKGKLRPWQYAGSIYGAVPAENSGYKGPGEWNSLEITCRGPAIEVMMNGHQVATADVEKIEMLKTRPRRGYIGLQNHGTGVEYRHIEIKAAD